MNKRILSISVLIVFLLAGFIYLNRVFSSSSHYVNTFETFKSLSKKTNIDVLFFGSSHAYTAYIPLIIDKESNTVSFNLGSDALRVPFTDLVVEESLENTTPELIVIEIYPPSIPGPENDVIKGYQLRALDMVSNFSIDKFKKVRSFYSNKELVGVYFPLIRNHNKWNEMKYFKLSHEQKFNEKTTFFNKGYIGFNTVIDSLEGTKFTDFREIEKYPENNMPLITETGKIDIIRLIEVSKSQGSQVLIISSPDLRAKYNWSKSYLNDLENICREQGIKFLNLNDYYSKIDLKVSDFKDPSHLNIEGAEKSSRFLAEYINTNYKLKDRSSDSIWQKNHREFINFKKAYKSMIFKKELDVNLIESVKLKNIEIDNKAQTYSIKLSIDASKKYQEAFNKFSLSLNIFPVNENELSDYSKSKKWKFDKVDLKLKDKDSILTFQLNSKIKEINQIEIFLFNSEKYKGVIGEKLILKDIQFQ
ncbi:MAG: hypothetical protein Q8O62_06780 [Aequorivita sp.]|nr:hypothetical protein [Aequorivita sp.]